VAMDNETQLSKYLNERALEIGKVVAAPSVELNKRETQAIIVEESLSPAFVFG
jgi:hypothetical protein